MKQDTTPIIGHWIKTLWALSAIMFIMVSITAGESATIRVTATVVSPFGYCDSGKTGNPDQGEIGADNKAVFLSNNSAVICQIDVGNFDSKEFLLDKYPLDIGTDAASLMPLDSIRNQIEMNANPEALSFRNHQPVIITFFYSEN